MHTTPCNDVGAFAKLSHVTYVRTATDGNMSVVALNFGQRFLCRSHILALIFATRAQIKCNTFPAVLLCTYSDKFEITGLI